MQRERQFVPISFEEASQRSKWSRQDLDVNQAAVWEYLAVLVMRVQNLEEKVNKLDR